MCSYDGLYAGKQRHEDALATLGAALAKGIEPSQDTLTRATTDLIRYVCRRFPSISTDDAADIVSDAILGLLRQAGSSHLIGDRIVGYLVTAVRNGSIDHLKRARTNREISVAPGALPETTMSDEVLVRILNQDATVARVREAMQAVRDSGDTTGFRVAACLLDEIEATGQVPSNRRLAELCGLSHTGVAKALLRFRSHVKTAED